MKRALPGLAVAITGMLLVRLLVTGEASFFVGPLVRPLLIAIAPVLIGLGSWQVVASLRSTVHTHDHGQLGKVLALLVIPLAIVLAGPQPLGLVAQAAPGRGKPSANSTPVNTASPPPVQVDPQTGKAIGGYGGSNNDPNQYGSTRNAPIGPDPGSYSKLTGEPAEIGLYDYVQRSSFGHLKPLTGRKLSMIGFVSRDPDNPKGPWVLARLKMWCCAADALPFLVTAVGGPQAPYGSWVRVTGQALPGLPSGDAQFKVEKVEKISTPKDPYVW